MKTKRVYTVVWFDPNAKQMTCIENINHFSALSDAEQFASTRTLYGEPATVQSADVPVYIARRWGIE